MTVLKLATNIVWGLVLVVCVVIGISIKNKIIGPEGWAEDDAIKALKQKMKDPDSMVIRSSYVVTRNIEGLDYIAVCGVVDGKNSFGVYAGGSRFVSISTHSKEFKIFETVITEIEDTAQTRDARSVNGSSGFEVAYWNEYCVNGNHQSLASPGS